MMESTNDEKYEGVYRGRRQMDEWRRNKMEITTRQSGILN